MICLGYESAFSGLHDSVWKIELKISVIISFTYNIHAKHHASLLSSCFLLENSLYVGVSDIVSFQKLVGNLDKMTVANLSRQK